jgi:predicted PurR-regulated permease PerM
MPDSPGSGSRPSPRTLLVIGAAVVLGLVLYQGREALSPFIVGLLLVYLLNPLVERITRLGAPRWVAVLLVYILVIVGLVEALSLTLGPLVGQATQFISDLPRLAAAVGDVLERLTELYRGLPLPADIRASLDASIADLGPRLAGLLSGLAVPVFGSVAALVSSVFGYLIIPVWVFYLLKDRPQLMAAFDRALPAEWRDDVWALARIVQRVFAQWIRGQVVLGVTVGIATYIGLMLLGALVNPIFGQFALLLALIAGLLELLPIIGPIIAAIPAVLLAATAGLEPVIAALVLYTVVQQVENAVLVPKIQGDAIELHPSAVMFALVVGGAIAGLLGAILSLPIAAAGRNIYRYLFRRVTPDPQPPDVAARGLDGSPLLPPPPVVDVDVAGAEAAA